MANLNEIKRKLNSVDSVKKITHAMNLIATVKLKKQRDLFDNVKDYFQTFYAIVGFLLDDEETDIEELDITSREDKTLSINVNSTIGLCGAYNTLLNNYVYKRTRINNDKIIQIGKQGYNFWNVQHENESPIIKYYEFNDMKVPFSACLNIADEIWKLWVDKEINKIEINFMRFVNVMVSKPQTIELLPFDRSTLDNLSSDLNLNEFEFSPEKDELLISLIPEYLATVIYGALIEAKTSEYASRRMAMDAATKNSDELSYQYKLQYNNARQEQITNEIIEIVSPLSAMKKKTKKEKK